MLEGCISEQWARVQSDYLAWIGSRKSERRWAVALIKKLWEVAWDQWEHRNAAIYETPVGVEMSGRLSLTRAIKAEILLGKPIKVQSTFPTCVEDLLNASIEHQQYRLVLVRATREMNNDYRILDELSDPRPSLRKWLGL